MKYVEKTDTAFPLYILFYVFCGKCHQKFTFNVILVQNILVHKFLRLVYHPSAVH